MSTDINFIRALPDPQRSYKWRVQLPNFGQKKPENTEKEAFGLSRQAIDNVINAARSTAGSYIDIGNSIVGVQSGSSNNDFDTKQDDYNPSLLVEEIQGLSLPNIDRDAFYEGGRETYYPTIETVSPITITFHQDVTAKILDYMMTWKRKIIQKNGIKNLPKEYKYNIVIELLNGYNESVYKFTLSGCFPTNTNGYTLNNSSENLKLIQEFSVDRIVLAKQDIDAVNNLRDRLDGAVSEKLRRRGVNIQSTITNNNAGNVANRALEDF